MRGARKATYPIAVCTILAGLLTAELAIAQAIERIRISRSGNEATAEIELGCDMRYTGHSPQAVAFDFHVRLELGYDCQLALRGAVNYLSRPLGRQMARLGEVEFDKVAANEAVLSLRFEQPVVLTVSQTANRYMLTAVVDTLPPGAAAVSPPPAPTVQVQPPQPDTRSNADPARRVAPRTDPAPDLFVVRLAAFRSIDDIDRSALQPFRTRSIYTREFEVGGRDWVELRLGFFATEEEAHAELARLEPGFPGAWITVAPLDEQLHARRNPFDPDAPAERETEEKLPPATTAATVAATMTTRSPGLDTEATAELMTAARAALVRDDVAESIALYTRVLQESTSGHRREAREYLGVARQRNGQPAHARSEFEAYLTEFPDGDGARRVRQRLAALMATEEAAVAEKAATPAPQRAAQSPRWEVFGSASQHYLRGVNLSREDEADLVMQSALLSQANLALVHRGDRFDLLGRANLGFLYDLQSDGPGNQALVSFAYIDMSDKTLGLDARVGRQTQHKGGILGRFDGAHLSYGLLQDVNVNVSAGFPVDSPRFLASTDHYFYGASVELVDILNGVDLNVFTNVQDIDGIADRRAFGAEAQYHVGDLNIVGLLDYDASYRVLNNGLIAGNWRVNDRLTLHGRYQGGAGPYLTTRNAIIGQPVNTIEALLDIYTEGQLRRLARNRTAERRSGSAGVLAAVSQRVQLNADVTFYQLGSTVASGGVDAVPGTGPRYSYNARLLASSLIKGGDSVQLGFRHDQSDAFDANTVSVDARLPFGERLRVNPRIAVTLRNRIEAGGEQTDHWIAQPMLRLFYTWRRNSRVEFEVGGQWSNQELPDALVSPLAPDGTIESSSYYLQLGYWIDF